MSNKERSFGWQVGTVLVLLGAWRWAHGRGWGVTLVVAGVLLAAAGFVAPRSLTHLQRAWMGLGHLMERVMRPLVTALLYFVVVTPVGWIRRHVGRSPLARDPAAPSYWVVPDDGAARDALRDEHPY